MWFDYALYMIVLRCRLYAFTCMPSLMRQPRQMNLAGYGGVSDSERGGETMSGEWGFNAQGR